MNNYETVCIVRPDLGDEAVKAIIQKAATTIESGAGKVVKLEEWGRRKLSYPIQKKNEGYYFIYSYSSSAETSKELERTLRYNEDVLRYQTIRIAEQKPVEANVAEAAAKEEPKGGETANGNG